MAVKNFLLLILCRLLLLLDYKISFKIEQHGEEHLKLTEIIRQYCEKMPEFQLLYKCQKEKRKFIC